MTTITKSLRTWFVIHFFVDMLFALPLMFSPEWTLNLIGLNPADTLAPRIVGAALIAIGGNSLLMANKKLEHYQTMLNLKVIWSSGAILAIILEIAQKPKPVLWPLLGTFIFFTFVWHWYRIKLNKAS